MPNQAIFNDSGKHKKSGKLVHQVKWEPCRIVLHSML